MPKNLTILIGLYEFPEIVKSIDSICEKEGISRSDFIRRAIRKELKAAQIS